MIFPKAIIFDFDSGLIDSEKQQIQAWISVLEELDINLNERQIRLLSGYTDKEIAYRLLEKNSHLAEEAVKKIQKMLENIKYIPKKGVEKILRTSSKNAIPVAIVSTSDQEILNKKLIEYGWQDYICYVIGGRPDISPKPSPLLYDTAVNLLKLESSECVAVEDTLPGLEAVHHACCITIALAGTFKTDELAQHADYVIEELLGILTLFELKQRKEEIINECVSS